MKKLWIGLGLLVGIFALAQSMDALKAAAKKEGKLVSYGSPADWAGYGYISDVFNKQYRIKHTDTDMSSAEELQKWEAEKASPVSDVGDIGLQFGPIAADKGLLLAYKNSKWADIPDWAKDADGYYAATYYGTIAFLVNTKIVKNVPKSFKDLLKPEYKGMVAIQDPRRAANAQYAVIAASFANGGSENNLKPGIDFFAQLQKSGNLKPVLPNKDTLAKGEVGIGLLWDFQGLAWRKDIKGLVVQIPQDGTTYGPYATVIAKTAPNPNAAKLWIETVLSDAGQIAFARAGARPIRSNVKLPADLALTLLPEAQYKAAKPVTNWKNMEAIAKQIGDMWTTDVLGQ